MCGICFVDKLVHNKPSKTKNYTLSYLNVQINAFERLNLKLKKISIIMNQINLPIPNINNDEHVEINMLVGKEKKEVHFKVVPFVWEEEDELSDKKDSTSVSLARISRLKKSIENYDKSWELLQIFAPLENSKFIQVLYRKRA